MNQVIISLNGLYLHCAPHRLELPRFRGAMRLQKPYLLWTKSLNKNKSHWKENLKRQEIKPSKQRWIFGSHQVQKLMEKVLTYWSYHLKPVIALVSLFKCKQKECSYNSTLKLQGPCAGETRMWRSAMCCACHLKSNK